MPGKFRRWFSWKRYSCDPSSLSRTDVGKGSGVLFGTKHTFGDAHLDSIFLILLFTQQWIHYLNSPSTDRVILVAEICNIGQYLPTSDHYLQIVCRWRNIVCWCEAYGLDMAADFGFIQEFYDSNVRIKQYRVIVRVQYNGWYLGGKIQNGEK